MYVGPLPDGSFPIHSEAELGKIKAAIDRVDFNRVPVVLPKGMTAEDYQNMNILPGNRIGWEKKQEHVHRLSDLYTLGYLTEEEYEKRTEWVNNAQTTEQVNIVFTDLRQKKMTLTAEADSYLKPAGKDSRRVSFWVFMVTGVAISTCILLAMMGAWLSELIIISGSIIFAKAAHLYYRLQKELKDTHGQALRQHPPLREYRENCFRGSYKTTRYASPAWTSRAC